MPKPGYQYDGQKTAHGTLRGCRDEADHPPHRVGGYDTRNNGFNGYWCLGAGAARGRVIVRGCPEYPSKFDVTPGSRLHGDDWIAAGTVA